VSQVIRIGRSAGFGWCRRLVVITAVLIEDRSQSQVARDYGVSQSWISRLVARDKTEGDKAFEPRSRQPHTSPHPTATIDLITDLGGELRGKGLDHGPHTIAWHLHHHHHLSVGRDDQPAPARRRPGVTQPAETPSSVPAPPPSK